MANINIFALGGQDENGKDLFILEVENDIYVINAGIKFPINDRWGIDGIIADISYLEEHKDRIKGVFLTHAHDESFAALPWMIMDLPGLTIYGSKFTTAIAANRVSKYKVNHSNFKFEVLDQPKKIGSITVKPFEVANSIPGSLAFNFQTPDGDVIVMSNMTIDSLGSFGTTNLEDIKKNSNNILALLLDSRTANYNGPSAAKKSVKQLAKRAFDSAPKDSRILFGAFDEEMFTVQEIIDLANEYGRPVAFYGSAFDILYAEMQKDGKVVNKPNRVIDYREINNATNAVVIVSGTWSRLYQRWVRIATDNDVYLKLRSSDAILMIAPPINGMEVEYSEMLDDVAKRSPNIVDITNKDYYRLRPTKDDVATITSILKPKYFIPISSLYRYQVVATKAAVKSGMGKDKVIVAPNGRILYFQNGELASQKGKIREFGDVIIQGFGVGDVSFEVIKERKSLAAGGMISIAAQVDRKTKQLVGDLNIQIVGVVVKDDLKEFQEEIQNMVIQKFEEAPEFDYREIQNSIRKRVQKVMQKKVNKEPLVVITFYEV